MRPDPGDGFDVKISHQNSPSPGLHEFLIRQLLTFVFAMTGGESVAGGDPAAVIDHRTVVGGIAIFIDQDNFLRGHLGRRLLVIQGGWPGASTEPTPLFIPFSRKLSME